MMPSVLRRKYPVRSRNCIGNLKFEITEGCETCHPENDATYFRGAMLGVASNSCGLDATKACAAPTGLGLSREHGPTAPPSLRSGQARWATLFRPWRDLGAVGCAFSSLKRLGSCSTTVRAARYKPDVQMSQRISLECANFLAGSPSEFCVNKWGSDVYSGGLSFLRQDQQVEPAPGPVKYAKIHDS
jgi:hypothetical protein